MIDEELYQQAADELNSDRRIPHIWARACALASDDHDEARYLYTNLRVEELISEREAGIASGAIPAGDYSDDSDPTLALEPISGLDSDKDEDDDSIASNASELDFGTVSGINPQDQDIPSSVSAPSGVDGKDPSDDSLEFNPFYAEESEPTESPRRKSFEEKFDERFGTSTDEASTDVGEDIAASAGEVNEFEQTTVIGDETSAFADTGDQSSALVDAFEDGDQSAALRRSTEGAADQTSAFDAYDEDADKTSALDDSIEFDGTLRFDSSSEFDAGSGFDSDDQLAEGTTEDSEDELDDSIEFDGTAVMDFDPSELADIARPPHDIQLETEAHDGHSQEAVDSPLQQESTDESHSIAGDEDLAAQSLSQNSEQLDTLLSGVNASKEPPMTSGDYTENDEAILTGDFSDATSAFGELVDEDTLTDDSSTQEELDWLDQEMHTERPSARRNQSTVQDDEAERLVKELERQADDLPGQHSDVVATTDADKGTDFSELTAALPDSTDELTLTGPADQFVNEDLAGTELPSDEVPTPELDVSDLSASDRQAIESPAAANLPEDDLASALAEPELDAQDLPVAAAIAASVGTGVAATASLLDSNDSFVSPDQPDWPIDLSDEHSGTRYGVYRRDQQAQAVKTGVSWSALFLTIPFLIYRHLFGTAIVYSLMWIVIAAGLVVTGLAWLDAGDAATPLIKAFTIGFGVLGLIGLFYVPFRYGNSWRAEKLEKRGFELAAKVRASNPGKGIAQARRAAALD